MSKRPENAEVENDPFLRLLINLQVVGYQATKSAILFVGLISCPERRDVVEPFPFNLMSEAGNGLRADAHCLSSSVVAHMRNQNSGCGILFQPQINADNVDQNK